MIGAAAASRLYAGRDLIAVGFVWRSLQHPAQTIRDGQAAVDSPTVLAKELVVIDGVTAVDRLALGKRGAVASVIINAVPLGQNTHYDRSRAIVVGTEATIHQRIAIVAWIQWAVVVGDPSRVEIDHIGLNVRERV